MKKFLKLFSLFVAPFIILGCGSSDDDDGPKNHLSDATYDSADNVDKTGGYYAVKGTADNASYTATVKNSGLTANKATNIEINGIVFNHEKGGTVTLSAYKGNKSIDVTISLVAQTGDTETRQVKVQAASSAESNVVAYKKDGTYTVSIDIDPSATGNDAKAKVYVWNVASGATYTTNTAKATNTSADKGDGTGVTLTVTKPGTKVKALHIGEPKIKATTTTGTTS